MEYRQLGRSGLRVSTITLGTMGFGGTGWASAVGQIDVDGARKQISLARDAGVNLIDTADVYSNGQSEQIVGEALGSDRADVLVATKLRMPMGDGPNDAGLSRHHIIRAAEASLRRLGTDWIDLYKVHVGRPAGSSANRPTTRCRPATPRANWCPSHSTWASASWSGARSRAACCPESTAVAWRLRLAAGT